MNTREMGAFKSALSKHPEFRPHQAWIRRFCIPDQPNGIDLEAEPFKTLRVEEGIPWTFALMGMLKALNDIGNCPIPEELIWKTTDFIHEYQRAYGANQDYSHAFSEIPGIELIEKELPDPNDKYDRKTSYTFIVRNKACYMVLDDYQDHCFLHVHFCISIDHRLEDRAWGERSISVHKRWTDITGKYGGRSGFEHDVCFDRYRADKAIKLATAGLLEIFDEIIDDPTYRRDLNYNDDHGQKGLEWNDKIIPEVSPAFSRYMSNYREYLMCTLESRWRPGQRGQWIEGVNEKREVRHYQNLWAAWYAMTPEEQAKALETTPDNVLLSW